MRNIAILLLAAGSSSRMEGRDKLLEEIDGTPLLTRICTQACETDLPVYVTLPSVEHPRAAFCPGATLVPVADAAEGMAASIRTGVAALPADCDAVMILPSDMPELETRDLLVLADAPVKEENLILRACAQDGTPGHPVLFPRACFEDLTQLSGDQGARAVLKRHPVRLVALSTQRALIDLDTPEAWAAWRATRQPRR